MNDKSALKHAGLCATLVIVGGIFAVALLMVSNEPERNGSTAPVPDTAPQANVIQEPAGTVVDGVPNANQMKDETGSARLTYPPNPSEIEESGSTGPSFFAPSTSSFQETLFSKTDKPKLREMAANSTSPPGIARDETEEERPASGGPDGARQFRNLQMQDQDGRIPLDGYEKAHDQLLAMKSRQMLEAKSNGKSEGLEVAGINPASWAWLGPGNIGGRIRSMVIHPTNANSMWVGSVSGGIWHTVNAGVSWLPVDDFMANLAVSSLIIDPTNPNVMYAGTGEAYSAGSLEGENISNFGLRGDGIFKSTDGGVTWNRMPTTRPSGPGAVCGNPGLTCPWSYINRLAISPNGQNMLAATFDGIEITTNGGILWQTGIGAASGTIDDIDFDPQNSQNAVAGIPGGSLFSTDGGNSWTAANYSPPIVVTKDVSGRVEMAYAPSFPSTVYAMVDATQGAGQPPPVGTLVQGNLYRSINGGANFTLVNASNPGNTFLGSQGYYDNIIWVNPLDPNFVIVGGVKLYRSTDGGLNWVPIADLLNPGSAHSDHHMIVASPAFNNSGNKQVYFTNDGGVYRADNVSTVALTNGWTKLNNNLGITQFYSAAAGASGSIIGGTQDNGTIRFNSATLPWTETFGGDGGFVAADPVDPNYLFGEYTYLAVHRSSNGGTSASYIFCNPAPPRGDSKCLSPSTGITDANNGANFIAPLVLDPNNSSRLLAGGLSLWQSNDIKNTNPAQNNGLPAWTAIKAPIAPRLPVPVPPATPKPTPPISAIVVSPNNSDFVVVGYNDGQIYLTFNGTATPPNWSRIDTGIPATPARFVTRLVIDETRGPNWIYATFGGFAGDNIYCTRDLGSTWTDVSGAGATSIPSAPIRSLLINPIHRDYLYAGTELGVFASEDGGLTWGLPQDGPANVSVDELFWYNGRLAAATFGRGVYVTAPLFVSNGGSGSGGGAAGISCPLNASGNWFDPLSWSGGHVPTAADDVTVVCPLTVNSSAVVRNLRVNSILAVAGVVSTAEDIANFGSIYGSGAIWCRNLSNSGSLNPIRVISATGNVVNGGSINVETLESRGLRNAGSLNVHIVTVKGDFDNSGSMIGTSLYVSGGPTHNFSGTSPIKFASGNMPDGQTIKFLTDMTFDIGTFSSTWPNDTMDFNGKTLTFLGSSYSATGSVLGTGTLRLAPTNGTVVLAGNAPGVNVVSGLTDYRSGGTFNGPLTVGSGTTFLLSAATVSIKGDATINGVVTRDTVYGGSINFFGSTFTNNGGVTVDWVRFNPSGPIPLSQNIAGAGVWSGKAISIGNNLSATPSTVTLQNDVTFASDQLDVRYTFNLNGHVLTFTGIGNYYGTAVTNSGSIAGPGTFRMQPASGTPVIGNQVPAARWGGELEIASGSVRTGNLITTGPVTIDAGATLQLNGQGNAFRNNVVNNGTINMLNSSSLLYFSGSSFTNNGSIDAANVYFSPLAAQQMELSGSGTWTGAGILYFDPLSSTRLTSDVTYGSGSLRTDGAIQVVDPAVFSVPCTVSWTGTGEVMGNIRRTNLAACPGAAISYGNPFTTIAFNSGTPPSEVLVSVVSSPLVPVGFPDAVHRSYTITPTGGSGYSATLRLHYLDSELNGNNENALNLWRFNGLSWTPRGATNRNSTNNWVEYSGVTQFSPWAISGTLAPTQHNVTFQTDGTAGATLTGSTSQMVIHGANAAAVTANPPAGYHFVNWTGTGGFATTAANPLTVSNVLQDMTITAHFAANGYRIFLPYIAKPPN